MGLILENTADYQVVREILGNLQITDVTNANVENFAHLGFAEADMTAKIAKQAANGVPSVAQIMAGAPPATAADKIFLKAATANYVAFLMASEMPNLVNTSAATGEQEISFGGLGNAWITFREMVFGRIGYSLAQITNWVETTPDTMLFGGPTSSGYDPDTVSGFGYRYLTF